MKSRLVLSRHVAGIHALAALALFCQISNVQKVFTSNRNNGGLQTLPRLFQRIGVVVLLGGLRAEYRSQGPEARAYVRGWRIGPLRRHRGSTPRHSVCGRREPP